MSWIVSGFFIAMVSVFGAVAYLIGGLAVWFFYPASDRADSMASELNRGAT